MHKESRNFKGKKGGKKLTASKVKLLKDCLRKGKTKKKILAKQFGISMTQVKRIERGENWKEIK